MITPVAHKYAQAFLNVYGDRVNQVDIEYIEAAHQFLMNHKRALFFLRVPFITDDIKQKNIALLCERFSLPAACISLFAVLQSHNQGYLFAEVLAALIKEYKKRHAITRLTIKSSCALTQDEKEAIEQYADAKFPGKKEYVYSIDPALIAGIKISSGTLQWESSIQQYLRDCAQAQI